MTLGLRFGDVEFRVGGLGLKTLGAFAFGGAWSVEGPEPGL